MFDPMEDKSLGEIQEIEEREKKRTQGVVEECLRRGLPLAIKFDLDNYPYHHKIKTPEDKPGVEIARNIKTMKKL